MTGPSKNGLTEAAATVLTRLEAFGYENDLVHQDRAFKMLNLERSTARLLHLLVRATRRRRVLEVGTSNGVSAIWLASALLGLPDAEPLVTLERDADKHEQAVTNIAAAGLARQVRLLLGDPRNWLPRWRTRSIACSSTPTESVRRSRSTSCCRSSRLTASCSRTMPCRILRNSQLTGRWSKDFRVSAAWSCRPARVCTSRIDGDDEGVQPEPRRRPASHGAVSSLHGAGRADADCRFAGDREVDGAGDEALRVSCLVECLRRLHV
jgi:hypothetical protein